MLVVTLSDLDSSWPRPAPRLALPQGWQTPGRDRDPRRRRPGDIIVAPPTPRKRSGQHFCRFGGDLTPPSREGRKAKGERVGTSAPFPLAPSAPAARVLRAPALRQRRRRR